MPERHRIGISRRKALAAATAAVAGGVLPSWPDVSVASINQAMPVVTALAPLTRVWRDDAFELGLSRSFRNKESFLWRKWSRYLRDVEPSRSVPDENWVNFRRWYVHMWLTSVAGMVPKTENDHEVLRVAFRMIDELLGDLSEVPWCEDALAKLHETRGRAVV